ncbi:MAG TPA: biotin--[acetyl-CoA-carboxylase] ligase [Nitrospiraceae bacterium]|nr:biotin--[acetyl-CoA-carboxylase] ligase [Nitrospiraceae bacterium]
MQPSPPLARETIHSTLSTKWLGHRIELFDSLPSTNREAVQLAQAEVEHGTVVAADSQTAGRGRLSRTWFSPPGANLYCSIILRTARPPERLTEWLSWLPLISALATAEAIEQVSAVHVSVKWPNDLLISERKVGGILCESGTGARSDPFQIIGIGINVNGERDDWPDDLRSVATSIWQERNIVVDRNRLLAQLLLELEQCLDELAVHGTNRLALAYYQRCSTIGITVRATLANGDVMVGLAEGIGQDGSLRLRPQATQPGSGAPEVVHLRVADIIHVRI